MGGKTGKRTEDEPPKQWASARRLGLPLVRRAIPCLNAGQENDREAGVRGADLSSMDLLGAFCVHASVTVAGAPAGPLAGSRLAVKDLFDIAGHRTGAGCPAWLAAQDAARDTAPAVRALLDAGASVVGKTVMDEMAYGLTGENAHYGAPTNPRTPLRFTGGSSSGSAAAVAGGLADIALGTDTGGSVRIPASFCGLYGFRPSHGRVSAVGVVPLAPSFDTVGWFAREAGPLAAVGRALLGAWDDAPPSGVLVVEDAFGAADAPVRTALGPALDAVTSVLGPPRDVTLGRDGFAGWREVFRVLQSRDAWRTHGAWIAGARPDFSAPVAQRFAWAATVTEAMERAANEVRARMTADLDRLLAGGAVLCLPTAPTLAPARNASAEDLESYRARTLCLTCIAGLAGLPQVTLPLAEVDGCPVGLSLIARRGADGALLDAAVRVAGVR